MPYAKRKSIYFDNDKIRDIIFKGYTIVYRINEEENCIEIFGFTKYQDKPTDESSDSIITIVGMF